MTIRVLQPGLFTTVQDRGRYGYAHLGISPAGAADAMSLRIANLLVGNEDNAPALEMTLLGATLEFLDTATIAICGADCDCRIGQQRVAANTALEVHAGSVIRCGSTIGGARIYLAAHGGIDVPTVMGSASTDVRGRFGGVEGRRLQAGDVLRLRSSGARGSPRLATGGLGFLQRSGPLRVTKGPQHDWFSAQAHAQFFTATYTVSQQSDRAGLRLTGTPVSLCEPKQLLTDGIPLGAIQVPQDGQPIILFVDQQTTGGYPKIANVIAADMYRVGQLRPRDTVRFVELSLDDAIAALRAQENWLKCLADGEDWR